MTTDRLAALLAEVTTRANAVVREQDAIDFIDWCRDDLPVAAGVIVAQPAEWPCVNCGSSLVVCGEPRCCNDCDHPAAARGVHIGCDTDLAYEAGRQDGAHEATLESAHIVEQQGLALGRLRAAAAEHGLCSCADFGGPRPLGGGREYHYSGCDYDPALRDVLEEADRG